MKLSLKPLNVLSTFATTHEEDGDGKTVPEKPKMSPEETVQDLLIKNPGMNAPTFVNLLKVKGLKIGESKKAPIKNRYSNFRLKACASGSSFPAQQRPVKESFKINSRFTTRTSLLESAASDDGIGPTKFKVILIKEGLGNLRDGYYYTREALGSAVSVFEGKKCYANHPSSIEEQSRPERDVRDIIGHFENVRVSEDETGAAILEADFVMLPHKPFEWARAQVLHSIEYAKKFPDKDFVGLSINASGDAHPEDAVKFLQSGIPASSKPKLQQAIEGGLSTVRRVDKITDGVSVDLVTEAGAGGRICEIIK